MRRIGDEVAHLSDPIGTPRRVRFEVNNETPIRSLRAGSLTFKPSGRAVAWARGW